MESKCIKHHNCHIHGTDINRLLKALGIILVFMLIELWGHYKTNSLSLLADALHLVVDISGFLISILTLLVSNKKATKRMNWGYQRVEIIGAMGSVILIWIALGYLIKESIKRYAHPYDIEGGTFLWIAIVGLLFNIACMYVLHQSNEKQKNLNIRAAYVHVLGDIVQSIGVIIASFIIYFFPKLVIADIICTFFFACLVFISTFYIIKDGLIILAEGAPVEIDQTKIRDWVLTNENVLKVLDIKLWSLGVKSYAIIIKILVDHIMINEYEDLLAETREYLKDFIDEDKITIQIDTLKTYKDEYNLIVDGTLLNYDI